MKRIVLGIDTSNYTTSVALMYEDGELLANIKRPLPVKEGERGLRQSDAVFAHIKNLPSAMREAEKYIEKNEICCVGVSTRPRNVEGSYMPCFLSGVAAAESISATLGVPLYSFSHQCGHIMAALYSSGSADALSERDFCAFHVSGGTTEVLKVKLADSGFSAELVGGTCDLNAGQLIDRVGVMMGLDFPAGPRMEILAKNNSKKIPSRKPKINGIEVNLSGLENLSQKLYKESGDKELVSAFVFDYVGKSLLRLGEAFVEKYGNMPMVFAGGVMSNGIIKSMLNKRFDAYFAEPMLSADNAVGIAALALREHKKRK